MASKAIILQAMALLAVHLVMTSAGVTDAPPKGCVCRCPDKNPGANPNCYTRGVVPVTMILIVRKVLLFLFIVHLLLILIILLLRWL